MFITLPVCTGNKDVKMLKTKLPLNIKTAKLKRIKIVQRHRKEHQMKRS